AEERTAITSGLAALETSLVPSKS
ncbi:MarR family transcriptional regulator, partial [Mesorhizobium sp. M7A.F.Ca.US.003.02.2.1]